MIPASNDRLNLLASHALVLRMTEAFPSASAGFDARGLRTVQVAPQVDGFGALQAFVDDSIGFKLWIGRFGIAVFEFARAGLARDAAREIDDVAGRLVERCRDVVSDRVVCYRSILGIAGWYVAERPVSRLCRLLIRGPRWVWSGPLV